MSQESERFGILRDSPQDYINATFWGRCEEVLKLSDTFQIGDVVQVIRPRITIRSKDNQAEQYRPMVTSAYTLTLYGEQSQILRHEYMPQKYTELLRYPTKPLLGFVSIADIHSGDPDKVKYIDMLVAVGSIGAIRSVKMKNGIEQQVRDFTVLDYTSSGMRVSIWDPELMVRAGFWKPKLTVLFMTDLRVSFSQFHNSLVPNISSRTIITEDPIGSEADNLRRYAATAPLQPIQVLERLVTNVNPNAIQNVMTIQRVFDKIANLTSALPNRIDERHFAGLLYVFVTKLDLDGLTRVTSTRCSACKYLVTNEGICDNQECVVTRGIETVDLETIFDIRISLSDHTGTLHNCRLTGNVSENVLGCSVRNFMDMSDDAKWELKWKYLMERCAVRILVLCSENGNYLISVLSCTIASPGDVASKLPHF